MKNLDKLLSWLQTSEYDGVILGDGIISNGSQKKMQML